MKSLILDTILGLATGVVTYCWLSYLPNFEISIKIDKQFLITTGAIVSGAMVLKRNI